MLRYFVVLAHRKLHVVEQIDYPEIWHRSAILDIFCEAGTPTYSLEISLNNFAGKLYQSATNLTSLAIQMLEYEANLAES